MFLHFSASYLLIIQAPLQSPPSILSSSSTNFYRPISPLYLFIKPSLQSPPRLPPSIPRSFSPPYFYRQSSLQSPPQFLSPTSAIQQIQAVSRAQSVRKFCKDWHCFSLFLFSQTTEKVRGTYNHWFLIVQTQKTSVLQVVALMKI